MGLLDKLYQGSILSDYDGKSPKKFKGETQYPQQLIGSQLDLDGKTPSKYLDNPPG